MSDLSKFQADIQRIIKHDRADHGGCYDGLRASLSVAQLFEHKTEGLGDLPHSFTSYWLNTYIKTSKKIEKEPTEIHIEWLVKVLALLNGEFEKDMDFSNKDWKELASMTDYEAEELPLDILSDLMSHFVSHKIL